jgi:ubiquinone/menaquinone biosynthesis C-methylase UbiE
VILIDVEPALARRARQKLPDVHVVVANGERLPFATRSVGIIVCNSVIEHVDDPSALAAEIRRVGQSYFLQTPNGHFPLETHSYIAIPFYSWIPWMRLRRLVCRLFGASFDYVSSVRYISEERLRQMFPNARMTYEKALGMHKSFYVYDDRGVVP